jgi:hypothetical protein
MGGAGTWCAAAGRLDLLVKADGIPSLMVSVYEQSEKFTCQEGGKKTRGLRKEAKVSSVGSLPGKQAEM